MGTGTRRSAALLAAALGLTLAFFASAPAPGGASSGSAKILGSDASPARVTRAFFGALDRRDWDSACALMLPGTRRWIAWRTSCPRRLRWAFSATYRKFTLS